jgi:hypothetical protein
MHANSQFCHENFIVRRDFCVAQKCWAMPHPQHIVFGSPARFFGRGYFGARGRNETMRTQTEITPPVPATGALVRHLWAPAIIFWGLGLTVTWVALLAYGLLALILLII